MNILWIYGQQITRNTRTPPRHSLRQHTQFYAPFIVENSSAGVQGHEYFWAAHSFLLYMQMLPWYLIRKESYITHKYPEQGYIFPRPINSSRSCYMKLSIHLQYSLNIIIYVYMLFTFCTLSFIYIFVSKLYQHHNYFYFSLHELNMKLSIHLQYSPTKRYIHVIHLLSVYFH